MAKSLYSIVATFTSPDAIIKAAKKVRDAGYKKFDVHTPYPLHGMDKAMGLPETKLGFVTLAAAFLGGIAMISFASWVAAGDYQLVIGGKPYWSWPAFVPVTYEIAVLAAVVLTVEIMIIFFFKFPNTSHPLHDTPYMKKVSAHTFGISIQAEDPMFDEQKVRDLLAAEGGAVDAVYYSDEFLNFKPKVFDAKFLVLLAGIAVACSGGGYMLWNQILLWPPYDWMSNQQKVNPQSESNFYSDQFGMRMPVEGTVARGFMPYPYKGHPELAAKYLVNPTLPTKEILAIGQQKFLRFCSPCHGVHADGKSRLHGQFPNPPSLFSDKVRNWPDGSIFHVITEGQNIMPSYQYQVSREERWAIVDYIRAMQRAFDAKESDLP